MARDAADDRGSSDPDPTPPVTWPEPGSGFEADPLSPTGAEEQLWAATARLPRRRGAKWAVRLPALAVAVVLVAAQFVH